MVEVERDLARGPQLTATGDEAVFGGGKVDPRVDGPGRLPDEVASRLDVRCSCPGSRCTRARTCPTVRQSGRTRAGSLSGWMLHVVVDRPRPVRNWLRNGTPHFPRVDRMMLGRPGVEAPLRDDDGRTDRARRAGPPTAEG
ncbi:MAG: hypothetical protein ABJA34_03410 [Pseudonocardiales bacterium]